MGRFNYFGVSSYVVGHYFNGNYYVETDYYGSRKKRTLRVGEQFRPDFPDSIDLKITNKCSWGCPYCHESSTPNGKTYDFNRTIQVLGQLPKVGIELAIGGGNLFDIPEETLNLFQWAKSNGFLPRLTLNRKDFEREDVLEIIDKLRNDWDYRNNDKLGSRPALSFLLESLDTIGCSTDKYLEDHLFCWRGQRDWFDKWLPFKNINVVWHVIVGVLSVQDLEAMFKDPHAYDKILILGFKQFGRAKDMQVRDLDKWKETVRRLLWQSRHVFGEKKVTLGFDNLALQQLELQDVLSKKEWDSMYFGDEFSSTMYVDAVEETYAPTSRSMERVRWNEMGILDYFRQKKNEFVCNQSGQVG